MCFSFVIFFLLPLALALSGLLKPSLQPHFLETEWWYFMIWKFSIPYKQNTMWCVVVKAGKLLRQKRNTYHGRLTPPRNLAYCMGFSLNFCENAGRTWSMGGVPHLGEQMLQRNLPVEPAQPTCLRQVCACLPWGLPAPSPWAEGRFGAVYPTWPSIQMTFHHLGPADAKQ